MGNLMALFTDYFENMNFFEFFFNSLIVIIPLSLFFLVLILFRFAYREEVDPEYKAADFEDLSFDISSYFEYVTADLKKLGFEKSVDLEKSRKEIGHFTTYVILRFFINPVKRDSAIAVCDYTIEEGKSRVKFNHSYVEFSSVFSSKFEICRNNCKVPDPFAQLPEKKIFTYSITNLQELYALHRQAVEASHRRNNGVLPEMGEETDYLNKLVKNDMKNLAHHGYMSLDVLSNEYRPTWNGSYLIVKNLIRSLIGSQKRYNQKIFHGILSKIPKNKDVQSAMIPTRKKRIETESETAEIRLN